MTARAQRVLLVNDVVTTGSGLGKLGELVRAAGGEVAAAAWFISRADIDIQEIVAAPTAHVADLDLPAWQASRCRACDEDVIPQPALDIN